VDTVQQTASHAFDQVRDTGKHQLASQKDQVAGTIDQVANAMRHTGSQLRRDDQGTVAQFIDGAASQLEGVSSSLREKDLDQLVWEAESFARRQPALFLGGAFMLGLVAARFLRSGRPAHEETDRSTGYGYDAGARGDAWMNRGMNRAESSSGMPARTAAGAWDRDSTRNAWADQSGRSRSEFAAPRYPTGS